MLCNMSKISENNFKMSMASITQFTHVHNKNSNIQGQSPNVVEVIFHTKWDCFLRKEFAHSGSKFFPLIEVPILKRDAIEENRCLIQ